MSIQTILAIIVMVVVFLSRLNKKGAEKETQQRDPGSETDQKPMTFEELLKEIEGTKLPAKPIHYEAPLSEKPSPLENTNYDYRNEDTIYETYEKAKQEAFNRPSLEETYKLSDTIVRFGQFKGYQQENEKDPALDYLNDLKSPESFKKAFILSEILKPKF